MASHAQRTLFEIMRPVMIWLQGVGMITALAVFAIAVNPVAAQSNAEATPPTFTSETAKIAQGVRTPDQSDSIDL